MWSLACSCSLSEIAVSYGSNPAYGCALAPTTTATRIVCQTAPGETATLSLRQPSHAALTMSLAEASVLIALPFTSALSVASLPCSAALLCVASRFITTLLLFSCLVAGRRQGHSARVHGLSGPGQRQAERPQHGPLFLRLAADRHGCVWMHHARYHIASHDPGCWSKFAAPQRCAALVLLVGCSTVSLQLLVPARVVRSKI